LGIAFAKIGDIYAEKLEWPEALTFYVRSIGLQPNLGESYVKLAQVWLKLGRQDKAIEAYVALSGCYLNQLGLLLAQQNKWGEVFKCYQQICNLALNQTATYSQLGFNLVRQRWLDQTIDIDVKQVSLLPITYNPSPLCQAEKVRINMVGGGFQHSVCSSAFNNNEYVEWVKDYSADLSIHIDEGIFYDVNDNKKKFAWLAESSAIISHLIEKVKDNLDWILSTYQYIFCNDKRLLNIHPKFKFALPNAKPYIQNKNLYEKTKLVSMIVSNKTMCEGHIYRLAILDKYKASLDHFGGGFGNKELPNMRFNNREETGKILALKDYMFSIAMENASYPGGFCEKITDCFATGTSILGGRKI
jgi:tetratricopeptide (TPR) repeat protein